MESNTLQENKMGVMPVGKLLANMALPIWSIYMQKVYANEELGYSVDEQFDVPEWFDAGAGCK